MSRTGPWTRPASHDGGLIGTPHLFREGRRYRGVALLTVLAEFGLGAFACSVALLHWLRPDLDPAVRTVSEYALGAYGWVMVAAFLALGAGALALTVALAWGRPHVRAGRPILLLFGTFGLGTLVCALAPTDPSLPGAAVTPLGLAHDVAASAALICGLGALPVTAWAWRADVRWQGLTWPSLGLALLAGTAIPVVGGSGSFGWAERILVGVLVLWQWVVARRLRAVVSHV